MTTTAKELQLIRPEVCLRMHPLKKESQQLRILTELGLFFPRVFVEARFLRKSQRPPLPTLRHSALWTMMLTYFLSASSHLSTVQSWQSLTCVSRAAHLLS